VIHRAIKLIQAAGRPVTMTFVTADAFDAAASALKQAEEMHRANPKRRASFFGLRKAQKDKPHCSGMIM
jgi:hypothetical protein